MNYLIPQMPLNIPYMQKIGTPPTPFFILFFSSATLLRVGGLYESIIWECLRSKKDHEMIIQPIQNNFFQKPMQHKLIN
jgi:hypothetical protein